MKIELRSPSALRKTPLLIVLVAEGEEPTLPRGVELPALAARDFDGELRKQSLVYPSRGLAQRVLLIGLGKKSAVDAECLRRAAALGVKRAESAALPAAALWIHDALAGATRIVAIPRKPGCPVCGGF